MTVEETNWDALSKRFPEMRRAVESDAAIETEIPPIEFFPSRSGALTARWQGKSLASAFDPVAEARKTLSVVPSIADFAVVGGLGLGYHVRALAETYPDLPLVVVEPSARFFLEVVRNVELSDLFANVWISWSIGGPAQEAGGFLERFYCKTVAFVPLRPIWEIHRAWMQDLEFALGEFQAKARVNDQTLRRFYRLWFRNWRKNAAQARSWAPVKNLFGREQGKNAVVCAAGPSLEHSLDWIVRYRDRFVLVVVDTAWNAVRARGIEPDYLVFMDGQYWNSRHVDTSVPESTIVVAELCSHPTALRKAEGRTFVCASSVPLLRDWEAQTWGDLGVLKSGGSVTTSAWELAVGLGCVEVAFAGLDLGYPAGMTHAKGSQFEEAFHRSSRRTLPAHTLAFRLLQDAGLNRRPSVDGRFVLSDPRMDLYRDWLSRSFLQHPNVRVVNLSPIGSKIDATSAPTHDYGASWPVVRRQAKVFSNRYASAVLTDRSLETSLIDDWASLAEDLERGSDSGRAVERLESEYRRAQEYWGDSATKIFLGAAYASYRQFPGPRSVRALGDAWTFVVEVAEFWRNLLKTDK